MSALALVIVIASWQPWLSTVRAQGTEAARLFAVIVNGGRNKLTNHERYWNDCAFLYRTLRHTYHIPQRNITVLMSDGGAQEDDMIRADGWGFRSSPTDLDGDGLPDVNYSAKREMLVSVLYDLSKKLTMDDHLFLFFVDHGGSDDHQSDSFIWLWNDEKMEDYALAMLLRLFNVASMNILMGQCYSGGFIEELAREGRIMSTSCCGNEQSWASPNYEYDEFVYHWICAINGADEAGRPINADTDHNGEVSMAEAFEYARSHDCVNETPQYASWPEQLGEQWTFAKAHLGTLGIREVQTESNVSEEIWTLSGVRRQDTSKHAVYILRQGGKTRKVIR
jgi:hypothetical protein